MDLDHLKAPPGFVITGTAFHLQNGRLNLKVNSIQIPRLMRIVIFLLFIITLLRIFPHQIKVTPIDYNTGRLSPAGSTWIINNPSDRSYQRVPSGGDPAGITSPNQVQSSPGRYVTFGMTGKDEDASQMTVPYFDAQPVFTSPPSWISEVNLRLRAQPNSGGFLSFAISPYSPLNQFEQSDDVGEIQRRVIPSRTNAPLESVCCPCK